MMQGSFGRCKQSSSCPPADLGDNREINGWSREAYYSILLQKGEGNLDEADMESVEVSLWPPYLWSSQCPCSRFK